MKHPDEQGERIHGGRNKQILMARENLKRLRAQKDMPKPERPPPILRDYAPLPLEVSLLDLTNTTQTGESEPEIENVILRNAQRSTCR
jgi:hypothetical protein